MSSLFFIFAVPLGKVLTDLVRRNDGVVTSKPPGRLAVNPGWIIIAWESTTLPGPPIHCIQERAQSKAAVLLSSRTGLAASVTVNPSFLIYKERIGMGEIAGNATVLIGVGILFDFQLGRGGLFGQAIALVKAAFAGLTVTLIRSLRGKNGKLRRIQPEFAIRVPVLFICGWLLILKRPILVQKHQVRPRKKGCFGIDP